MKKFLSVLLAVMMLLSAMPVMAEEVVTAVTQPDGTQGTETQKPEEPKHETHGEKIFDAEKKHFSYDCDLCIAEEVTAKTCTDESWIVYNCQAEGCNDTFKVITKKAGKHTATLNEKGEIVGTPVKAPTCKEDGAIKTTCSVCGVEFEQVIDANPHMFGKEVTVEPTCLTGGQTSKTCELCGYVEITAKTEALDHDWCTEDEREYVVDTLYCYSEDAMAVSFLYCKREGCDATKSYPDGSMYFTDLDTYHQTAIEEVLKVDTAAKETAAQVAAEVLAAAGMEVGVKATGTYTFGQVEYVDVKGDKSGHFINLNDAKVEYVPETCYADGYITLTCAGEKNCGSTHTLVIPAHKHEYDVLVEVDGKLTKPTCLTNGAVIIVCTHDHCDFEEQIQINAPGKHDFENEACKKIYVQNTIKNGKVETEDKSKIVECQPYEIYTVCNGYHTTVKINNGKDEVAVSFTCTAKSEPEAAPEKLADHAPIDGSYAFSAPTCTEEGFKVYNCSACGETVTEVVKPFNHKKVDEKGNTIYDEKGNPVSAYEIKNPATDKKDPTCTEDGEIKWTCSMCGDVKIQVMPATGHGWDNDKEDFHFVWNKKPVCGKQENGSQTWTCDYCQETKDVVIPYTHTKPETGVSFKAPTCLTEGVSSYTCTVCHQFVKETEKALGHSWERENHAESIKLPAEYNTTGKTQWYDEYVRATCTVKGHYVRTCDDATCDLYNKKESKAYTETLYVGETMGHVLVSEQVTNKANLIIDSKNLPSCTETGKAYFNCALCGIYGYAEIELPTMPHNPVMKWNKTKNVYEYVCEEVKFNDANYADMMADYLYAEIIARIDANLPAAERAEIAEEYQAKAIADIKEYLREKKSVTVDKVTTNYEIIRGIGCGEVIKEIEIIPTHYTIKKDGNTVTLTPDENCALLAEPMLVVNWAYTLSDGTSFGYTRVIEAKNLAKLTYNLGVAKAPFGAKLDAVTVIVTDTDDADLTAAAKGFGFAQF